MVIISTINQKGGVGKTTTVHNIATIMSMMKKKVLVIDNDPQANLTISTGIIPKNLKVTIHEVMCDAVNINEAILQTKHFKIIPSNHNHYNSEARLIASPERQFILKDCLEELEDKFDFILIDCPANLGFLTINALTTSDAVIIPVGTDYLSSIGLDLIEDTINRLKKRLNPSLEVIGVIPTFYDGRTRLSKDTLECLKNDYNYPVMQEVPVSVKAKEAIIAEKCIYETFPKHPVSLAYENITKEIIKYGKK